NKTKKYVRDLEIENQILKKAMNIDKDTESLFEFIHQHRNTYAISAMCRLLKVSSTGYYKWVQDIMSDEERRYNYLKRNIQEIYLEHGPNIGSPAITTLLKKQRIDASQSTVSRILASNKKAWYSSYHSFHKNEDVVLHFPTKNFFWDINTNRFYHQRLAESDIQDILSSWRVTKRIRYEKTGQSELNHVNRQDNFIIHSENLLALYALQDQFKRKVKLIYIDPPYNGENYNLHYRDYFSRSSYLTFLQNRLVIAKELLKNDGVIFIHCTDKEQAYIKVLCDEIFKSYNFIQQVVWQRKKSKQNRGKMASVKDYILIF